VVIITSHIISELDDIVSKVMYLMDGKLHFYKPVSTIKQETKQPVLEQALANLLHIGFNNNLGNANT
jgi:Cu-processing system ATP-binding protein